MSQRISRDEMMFSIAKIVAQRSTCTRKQVGAVASFKGRIIAIGYCGSAPGQPHCIDVGCDLGPDGGCIRTQHAEVNLISFAARHGLPLEGCCIYCTLGPCLPCAKAIVAAGIKGLFYDEPYRDPAGANFLLDNGVLTIIP